MTYFCKIIKKPFAVTADGLVESVAVVDETVEAPDVAAGAHGFAVPFVVHPEHAVPCCRQPQAARCDFTLSLLISVVVIGAGSLTP
jgi:hypothetical protein